MCYGAVIANILAAGDTEQKCSCKQFVHITNGAEAHSEEKHWSVIQKLMLQDNVVPHKST